MARGFLAALGGRRAAKAPALSASVSEDGSAELVLYGDVVQDEPVNWFTGEPEAGLTISCQRVLDEIGRLEGAAALRVRLNSGGGDAVSGVAIHNALKALPCRVTVVVEGLAASAASLIACAGDEVVVMPGSMFMVHEGFAMMCGWYTPGEIDKARAMMDAMVKSMVNIYTAKTGRPEEEIEDMVRAETWLTGSEIVEAGFADSIAEDAGSEEADDEGAVFDGEAMTLTVRGVRHDASMYRNFPTAASAARVLGAGAQAPAQAIAVKEPPQAAEKKGDAIVETVEELREAYPELAAQIEAQAATAERGRIREIDEIAKDIAPDLVAKAKFEEPMTAAQLALASVKANAARGAAFLASLDEDGKESGADEIDADPNGGADEEDDEKKKEEEEAEAAIEAAAAFVNSMYGKKVR